MSLTVRASAGATLANLGPGYDVLGLCLEGPRDVVRATRTEAPGVVLARVSGDAGRLPTSAADNCAGVAVVHVVERFAPEGFGVSLELDKGLPLGSGLGSSAASSVAAAVAVAALIEAETGAVIPREALLDACREGERLATGSPHPDNVAPSLLGGIVACLPRGGEELEVVRLPVPEGLAVACVKPSLEVRTADARGVLPPAIPMADVVHNLAAVAGLVAGLASGDLALVGRSLEDRVVTPYRKTLIRGFDEAVAAARGAGALGAGISGSGPTLFALAEGAEAAARVAAAMTQAWAELGLTTTEVVGHVDPGGARLE